MIAPAEKCYVFTEFSGKYDNSCTRYGSEAEGAVVNDSQIYCLSRNLTEPQ